MKDIIARKAVEGASTLTQQLAKLVFLTPAKEPSSSGARSRSAGRGPLFETPVCRRRAVFTNPEFLRQGTAVEISHPTRVVIGRFRTPTPTRSTTCSRCTRRSPGRASSSTSRRPRSSRTPRTPSSPSSCRSRTRSPSLCEEAGADVDEVLAGIGADPRIGRTYMHPSFGFGGSCLPKELTTLAVAGPALGLPMHVTAAASAANLSAQDRFADRIADGRRRIRRADDRSPGARVQGRDRRHPRFAGRPARRLAPRGAVPPSGRSTRRPAPTPRPRSPTSRSWTTADVRALVAPMPSSSRPNGRSSATCRGGAGSTLGAADSSSTAGGCSMRSAPSRSAGRSSSSAMDERVAAPPLRPGRRETGAPSRDRRTRRCPGEAACLQRKVST